jgi:hypothetical protein
MFGLKTYLAVRVLESELKALRKDFDTLESYVDDRLKLIRNAENRVRVKSAKMEADTTDGAGGNGDTVPDVPMTPGLSPRQKLIQQQILRRRAGLA